MQIRDDILAGPHNRLLWCNRAIGLDTQLERREQRVRDFVRGENNVLVLEQALREEVAERVVFLVEGEDCGVWYT